MTKNKITIRLHSQKGICQLISQLSFFLIILAFIIPYLNLCWLKHNLAWSKRVRSVLERKRMQKDYHRVWDGFTVHDTSFFQLPVPQDLGLSASSSKKPHSVCHQSRETSFCHPPFQRDLASSPINPHSICRQSHETSLCQPPFQRYRTRSL